MKHFCRVLAVLLALLMLVTMATACKQEEDDWGDAVVGGDSFDDDSGDKENSDDKDQQNNSTDKNEDTDKNTGTDKNNGGDKDTTTDKNNDSNTGSDTENDTTVGAGDNENKQEQIVQNYDGTKKSIWRTTRSWRNPSPLTTGSCPPLIWIPPAL